MPPSPSSTRRKILLFPAITTSSGNLAKDIKTSGRLI
jgi:hypothetical protein